MDCALVTPLSPSTPVSSPLHKLNLVRFSPVTPCLPDLPVAACTAAEAVALRHLHQSASRRSSSDIDLLDNILRRNGTGYLRNRHVLVEWLVNVGRLLRISQGTLHTAVSHVDRCMAARSMSRKCWQLCAVAALLVAAKVEEAADAIPTIADLEYMCGGDIDADYIRRMEVCLLDLLNWDTLAHTPVHFLNLFQAIHDRCTRERSTSTTIHFTSSPTSSSSSSETCNPVSSHSRAMDSPLSVERRPRKKHVSHVQCCDENGDSPMREAGSECVSDVEDEGNDDDLSADDTRLSDFISVTAPVADYSNDVFPTAQCALDLALYVPRLRATYSALMLTSAAWAAARHVCQVSPVWSADMASITGLSNNAEMRACFRELVGLFERARDGE